MPGHLQMVQRVEVDLVAFCREADVADVSLHVEERESLLLDDLGIGDLEHVDEDLRLGCMLAVGRVEYRREDCSAAAEVGRCRTKPSNFIAFQLRSGLATSSWLPEDAGASHSGASGRVGRAGTARASPIKNRADEKRAFGPIRSLTKDGRGVGAPPEPGAAFSRRSGRRPLQSASSAAGCRHPRRCSRRCCRHR